MRTFNQRLIAFVQKVLPQIALLSVVCTQVHAQTQQKKTMYRPSQEG